VFPLYTILGVLLGGRVSLRGCRCTPSSIPIKYYKLIWQHFHEFLAYINITQISLKDVETPNQFRTNPNMTMLNYLAKGQLYVFPSYDILGVLPRSQPAWKRYGLGWIAPFNPYGIPDIDLAIRTLSKHFMLQCVGTRCQSLPRPNKKWIHHNTIDHAQVLSKRAIIGVPTAHHIMCAT